MIPSINFDVILRLNPNVTPISALSLSQPFLYFTFGFESTWIANRRGKSEISIVNSGPGIFKPGSALLLSRGGRERERERERGNKIREGFFEEKRSAIGLPSLPYYHSDDQRLVFAENTIPNPPPSFLSQTSLSFPQFSSFKNTHSLNAKPPPPPPSNHSKSQQTQKPA